MQSVPENGVIVLDDGALSKIRGIITVSHPYPSIIRFEFLYRDFQLARSSLSNELNPLQDPSAMATRIGAIVSPRTSLSLMKRESGMLTGAFASHQRSLGGEGASLRYTISQMKTSLSHFLPSFFLLFFYLCRVLDELITG